MLVRILLGLQFGVGYWGHDGGERRLIRELRIPEAFIFPLRTIVVEFSGDTTGILLSYALAKG